MCLCRSPTFSSQLPFQIADTLQSTIQSKTATLPKVEEAKTGADNDRSMPPFNANASSPSEVGSNVIYHHSVINKASSRCIIYMISHLQPSSPPYPLRAAIFLGLGRSGSSDISITYRRSRTKCIRTNCGCIWVHSTYAILMPFQKSAVLHILHARFQESSIQS